MTALDPVYQECQSCGDEYATDLDDLCDECRTYTPEQAGHEDEDGRAPDTPYWRGQARREMREAEWAKLGWCPPIHHEEYDRLHAAMVLHECEDGHHWREWPDGTVGPQWGYGLTRIAYPGWDPKCCPDPERGWSRYTDERNGEHGYKCPTCGTVHYVGGCGTGVRFDPWNVGDEICAPPPPHCGKPPVQTSRWFSPSRAEQKRGLHAGWVAIDAPPQPGEQLTFA